MADLAVLGLQIESDGAVTASANLDKLTASAAKAEKATDSAGKASERASQRMGAGSKAFERLLQAIEKVEKAVRDQNAALGNMGGAMARAEAQMEAASKAAQGVAASVTGAGTASSAAAAQVAALATSNTSAAAGMAATTMGAAKLGAGMQAANQNVKLTGNQLLNLSRQANDAFTMLASGSDITQVFATQIGQVYGALEEGPGGLRGSLKALGSAIMGLVTPTTLAIAGFGAAALAVRYFGDNTAANMEKAEKAAKSYASTVGRLRTAQGDLSKTMDAIFDRETISSTEQMRRELALLAKEQVAAKKALADNLLTAGAPGILEGLNPFRNARELYRMGTDATSASDFGKLAGEFERNERSAASLREELEKLKLNEDLPSDLQTIVDKMLDGARQAEQVEARIKAITTAIREQKREIATANYTKASDAFASFLPDTRTSRQQVQEAYYKRVEAIRQLQDNPRAMEGRQATADADRLTALREIERQEEVSRKGRELDIASVSARTTAERALLAAQRERLALTEPGANKVEVEQKALAASTQVYAEAERDAADALRQSQSAREQAGLEGYAAQVAAINAQYAEQIRLADGSAAAVEALRQARALDMEALDISTRKNLLGDQEEQIRTLREEAGMIGVNDEARRLALATLRAESDLRRQGIDLNSEWGQSYVANARQIETIETAIDKQTEAFEELHDAASDFFMSIGNGKGLLDNLANAFAGLGKKLASQGFDKIFGNLFGTAGQGGATGAGIVSALSQTVNQGAPAYSAGSLGETYAAPLGKVTRAALPPIVTGEGFSASKAASVAGQSVPARMWNFFAGKGLAPHQIAGILGQGKAESNFNPTAVGDNGQAFGLFQHNDRKQSLFDFIGGKQNLSNDVAQYEFVWKELQTTENKAFKRLLAAKDYIEANDAMISFERPAGYQNGVKNAHNYSGRLAATKEAYEKYGGQNVASSTNDTRDLAKGVSAGVVDANRKLETSYDRGGYDAGTPTNPTGAGRAGGLSGAGSILGVQYPAFSAMGGLQAGLGGFGAGYQSGSPIGGGLQGALGGFMAGGPIGGIIGLGAGILGGVLGGRQQRKAAHQEAAKKWEEMRPQYEAFDRSLSGEGVGNLRSSIGDMWGQLNSFMQVGGAAWKMGTGNSSATFAATGTKMFQKWQAEKDEFLDGFKYMLEDLSGGEGLDGAFAKGRSQVKALDEQIKGFIDDVEIAFNSSDIGIPTSAAYEAQAKEWEDRRNAAVAEAKRAAGEYAISLLYLADETSDVQKAIDSFKGTAAGLQPVLVKLGWSAEEAATVISEKLNEALTQAATDFKDGFERDINDLSDKGYLNDAADLLKQRKTALSDAALLGVDPEVVTRWFALAAQNIVDGAELTGEAFTELVKAFPALEGVVKAFVDTVEETAATTAQIQEAYQSFLNDRLTDAISARADAESNLRSAYEESANHLESFSKDVRDFLTGMRLNDNSPLSGRDQFLEAQKAFRETQAKAMAGDQTAQEDLLGVSQSYLDEAKSYYASSEDYFAAFSEVESVLKASDDKAVSQLALIKSQVGSLIDISDNTLTIAEGITKLQEAIEKAGVLQKLVDGNRSFGLNPERNRLIDAGLKQVGLNYTGNYGFQADGSDPFRVWREALAAEQLAVVNGIINQYIGINRQTGGLIPGYAMGGMVGNGIYNQDSVLARYAGGGSIGLAGGEMVISAPKVTPQTYPVLDAINRTGRVPANDTVRMDRVEALLRTLITTTGGGLQRVAETGEQGNRSSEQMALAARRGAANKQAA